MINEDAIRAYVTKQYRDVVSIDIRKLGSGVQGSGFLVAIKTSESTQTYVVKSLLAEGFGHDYPSDRASVFLLDLDEYKNLPGHVKAIDVLSELEDGTIISIGGGREYYLMMEKVEGSDYFNDLAVFAGRDRLTPFDRHKIRAMAQYLAEIHSLKKESKTLYWRKLRDTVGHGECLMGVFDIYPDGTLPYQEMADIIKKAVDWTYKLKPRFKRLARIHGDFHPGNIWFKDEMSRGRGRESGQLEFALLDRSRGPWGEPADDVTALAINYIFFSVRRYGDVRGAYIEGLKLFFDEYLTASGDIEIPEVTAPFFAFRCAVVANPVFYPDVSNEAREKIFNFARHVLAAERFEVARVNAYLEA